MFNFQLKETKLSDLIKTESKDIIEDAKSKLKAGQLKIAKNPVFNYRTTRPYYVGDWQKLEYDFKEIDKVATIEAYLQISFDKKLALWMKEGFETVGESNDLVEYIDRRINELCYVSKTTPKQFIGDIAKNIIRYSNCFVAIKREPEKSGGFPRKRSDGKTILPMSSLHILPTSMMQVKVNDLKQPILYRQYSEEDWSDSTRPAAEYKPEEIMHFYVNKLEGFVVGTPRASAAIEDIKSLRRIETDLEVLIHQSIFPIVQYIVGTEDRPATTLPDGRDEISLVTDMINGQPPEGFFVTPERHEIKMIGAEGRSLRSKEYLDYFKQRVLSALNLSSVDIGEGDTANRSTAMTMSRSLIDAVKADQVFLEEQLKALLIIPLLQESTKDGNIDWIDRKNDVKIRFREIDTENRIKKENQLIQLWLNNAITHDEFRIEIGENPMDEELWERTYMKMVKEPEILLAHSGALGSPLTHAAVRNPAVPVEEPDLKKAEVATSQSGKKATSGTPRATLKKKVKQTPQE
jgi:hypothetical protein